MKKIMAFCMLASFLIGCGATELEERCFPQVVAVGYEDGNVLYGMGFPRVGSSGEKEPKTNEIQVSTVGGKSFEESKEEYESHLNKDADYNHLKVFVMEEDFLEESGQYNEMLKVLAQTEEYPRNTYVCVVDDMEELMDMERNLPQDLGTYLEEYLNNHEENKDYMMTLGDLIDERENQELIVYLPHLDVEENFVQWNGYYAIGNE